MPAVLDTHAAIWYLLDSTKLPQPIYSLIDKAAAGGTPTYISAVSLVEVVYLVERGRIAVHAFDKFVGELESENPARARSGRRSHCHSPETDPARCNS
jgi:PIN domain nuclease of toxin-antitoxin system